MTYEEVVEKIRGLATRTIEDRFAIGKLVHELLILNYDIEKIAEEVGISAKTLLEYRETWMFWQDDRIFECTTWWCYRVVLGWPKAFLEEFDVIARAKELGKRVIEDCQVVYARRSRTLDRLHAEQQFIKTAPQRFVNHLWSTAVEYDELDFDEMSDDQVKDIARGFQAVISCANKFRKSRQQRVK